MFEEFKTETEDTEEEDFGVRWWDDLELKGKKARDEKEIAALNERLQKLYEYCRTDVEAERAAEKELYPLSADERKVYLLDQVINDRGIAVDLETTQQAIALIEESAKEINRKVTKLTNGVVTAVTQRNRIVNWLHDQQYDVLSLNKQTITAALSSTSLSSSVRSMLELRQLGSKSSVRKLQAILNMVEEDNRIRGNILYHGATTGRFSGKGVQLHNLPRPELQYPEEAIPYIKRGALNEIELCFGPVQNVVSDIIRSLIVAGPGKVFFAADFAAIEARVLAWVASQADLIKQFTNDDDIYLNFGEIIYGKKLNKKEHQKERQVAKAAILGLGFMMGAAKFKLTCQKAGIFLEDEEYERIVKLYRKKYHHITSFWFAFERAALAAVSKPTSIITFKNFKLRMRDGNLRIMLPSGRVLNYPKAKVIKNPTPWGEMKNAVEISAVNPLTRRWERAVISPGTFTENVVQAIARDLMVEAMFRLEEHNYPIVLTVHDEVVSEVDSGYGTVAEYEQLVSATPDWAAGLPVKAEGWTGERYRK